jgi:hypothetical protein
VKKQEEREAQARRDSANLARGEPPRNGLVLPFSNNIGPGNPIRPATNRADLIAQGHDLHYQQAKSDSDVLSADREAISQFARILYLGYTRQWEESGWELSTQSNI